MFIICFSSLSELVPLDINIVSLVKRIHFLIGVDVWKFSFLLAAIACWWLFDKKNVILYLAGATSATVKQIKDPHYYHYYNDYYFILLPIISLAVAYIYN